MNRRETYVCEVCVLPCRVAIDTSDSKLPREIAEQERFRQRVCLCREDTPQWTLESNEEIIQ